LDAIVMKALAKDRSARYPEAKALGSALEGWLLANAMPGSTAALADFMRDIYAERLAREQEEGRLLVESLDASKQEELPSAERERATPSLESMKRPTKAMRATQSAARPKRDLEVTAAERVPSRSGSTSRRLVEQAAAAAQRPIPDPSPRGTGAHTEASMPTQSSGRGAPIAAMFGVLVALLAVGVGVWLLNQPATPARLRLESTPPGAIVKRGDTVLCTTPCARDDLEPGAFTLRLEKEGFEPLQRPVTLESGADVSLGMLTMQPVAAVAVKPPQPTADAPTLVTIDSEPPGAEVRIDGELVGVTPHSRQLAAKTVVEVKLELANYQPLVEKLTVGEGAEDVRRYVLKAQAKQPVKPPVTRPPPVVEVKPPVVVAAKGTVRFIVKPWAEVDCPGMGIKDTTPFPDKQVPAGKYVCTFTNPEYPAKSVTVQVKAEDTTKVPVNFLSEK
ncbi:MAG TPA: PEGA domain-containing protein, partial [Archangium sp.]